ncbi:hypothetical protein Efla_001298 [Eimeria flavescens]
MVMTRFVRIANRLQWGAAQLCLPHLASWSYDFWISGGCAADEAGAAKLWLDREPAKCCKRLQHIWSCAVFTTFLDSTFDTFDLSTGLHDENSCGPVEHSIPDQECALILHISLCSSMHCMMNFVLGALSNAAVSAFMLEPSSA